MKTSGLMRGEIPQKSSFSLSLSFYFYFFLYYGQAKLGPRPEVTRSDPVTQEEWKTHIDKEGRVTNVPQLMKRIFKGVR